jgi:glucose/arabinose dehydrogenase
VPATARRNEPGRRQPTEGTAGWQMTERGDLPGMANAARLADVFTVTLMRHHFRRWFALLSLVHWSLAIGPSASAADAPKFELKDGDRVLFIGDTFFEREGDYGHIETRLTAAFPNRNVTFRNLAWAGDTPMGKARASFDWNKSEADWLKRVKEQVALAKPTVAFLSYGMTAALELAETKAEDQPEKLEKFKADLGTLMDAIDEVCGQKVRFVLLPPLQQQGQRPDSANSKALSEVAAGIDAVARAKSAVFADVFSASKRMAMLRMILFENPVTLNEAGYQMIADRLVEALGIKPSAAAVGVEILNAAIRKKSELFFHRWRPENWTYLFGFRKGEQGQNGVEIPRFDPLIAQWDARIAKLRDLKHQDPSMLKEVQELLAAEEAAHKVVPKPRKDQPVPTFTVADGFEVNLWAENPKLHKPIQMNWDAQGRLWVASSEVYPQIQPGQPATDSVVVLEDTNGDGVAETSTTFADGLLIPTGVLPDNRGGVYVAASSQLLHFADLNGDGVGDRKTVVLTSFGTEDTHHNLHTLRWGYDGHLYLNQSIYTHTHIETPWGVRRLNSAGIWRFNPDTWRLDVFTKGGCNPWGHHWDQYGNSFFTDGAGSKGVYHAMEGATYFTYSDMRREAESISPGSYPKFCSIELVHSPNFPADWQGSVITCDFRAHRVARFGLSDNGSTFQTEELPDVLRSTNVTFRPIDLRFGPDGALYVADWSNPIIQHGEVDFRDPRRDKEHGRIWRVTAKGGALGKKQDLAKLDTVALLDRTLSKSGWEQEQSRVVLRQRGASDVPPAVKPWLAKQTDPRAKLEAMWIHEAFGKPTGEFVGELVAAKDERLRVAAARQLSR